MNNSRATSLEIIKIACSRVFEVQRPVEIASQRDVERIQSEKEKEKESHSLMSVPI